MANSPLIEPHRAWRLRHRGGNCGQELSPVADKGNAQIFEVISRQLA
jgi:hypothetical protein